MDFSSAVLGIIEFKPLPRGTSSQSELYFIERLTRTCSSPSGGYLWINIRQSLHSSVQFMPLILFDPIIARPLQFAPQISREAVQVDDRLDFRQFVDEIHPPSNFPRHAESAEYPKKSTEQRGSLPQVNALDAEGEVTEEAAEYRPCHVDPYVLRNV